MSHHTVFNRVVSMLTPEEERDATQKQLLKLMDAYHEQKVQHAQLNAKYTALCVRLCQMEDLLREVGVVPPAGPAPHVTDDTEPLGVGNGYLVCSGV